MLWQDTSVLLVATTRENVSPSLILELLKRIAGIIKVRMSCSAHAVASRQSLADIVCGCTVLA